MQKHMCYDDHKWLWGLVMSLNIKTALSSRSVLVQPLNLLCLMLIKSFLLAHMRLIVSEYVAPTAQFDTNYDQTHLVHQNPHNPIWKSADGLEYIVFLLQSH